MSKIKYKTDRTSLEIIYTAFIQPILEYADVMWDNCSQQEKTRDWEKKKQETEKKS